MIFGSEKNVSMFFVVGKVGCDCTLHAFCRLFIFILYAVNLSLEMCFLSLLTPMSGFNRKKPKEMT